MKFRLKRQVVSNDLIKIISREMRRQRITLAHPTAEDFQEVLAVGRQIVQYGMPKYLVLNKLPNNLGHGVFLHPQAEPILRGQVIAPYAGEVLLEAQNDPTESDYAFDPLSDMRLTKSEQKQFDPKRRYHPARLYSLSLDAARKGNFTRFINHSEFPNVVAQLITIPKNRHGFSPSPVEVWFIAKKTIHPGEQLLVQYDDEEKSYWGASKLKPFPMTAKTFSL